MFSMPLFYSLVGLFLGVIVGLIIGNMLRKREVVKGFIVPTAVGVGVGIVLVLCASQIAVLLGLATYVSGVYLNMFYMTIYYATVLIFVWLVNDFRIYK